MRKRIEEGTAENIVRANTLVERETTGFHVEEDTGLQRFGRLA